MKKAMCVSASLSMYDEPQKRLPTFAFILRLLSAKSAAKLISIVIGGDVEISGGIAAAFFSGDVFTVIDPSGTETEMYRATKNLFAVMNVMGHTAVSTTMTLTRWQRWPAHRIP
jgi:hypothetical protein